MGDWQKVESHRSSGDCIDGGEARSSTQESGLVLKGITTIPPLTTDPQAIPVYKGLHATRKSHDMGFLLPGESYGHEVPQHSHRNAQEGVNVISRTLRNENDLLRYQLNDIIAREKNQRIELQRLRAHRDVEVASLVQAATQQLKGEVEQMKVLLQSTSAQLLQALTEKEKAVNNSQAAVRTIDELKHNAEVQETSIMEQLRGLETVFSKTCNTVTALANSVQGFQRHVLPTFKPTGMDLTKLTQDLSNKSGSTQLMVSELARLESSITLLRVIVDAKNDTLVLIRGKLKQENEELKAQLQLSSRGDLIPNIEDQKAINPGTTNTNDMNFEKKKLRQEFQSLQDMYNAEVKQLKAKLKLQDEEEIVENNKFCEIQHECLVLQNKIDMLEATKNILETRLKDETSARSQLVSQIFNMRKEQEKITTELETLKLNQKFLIRQPRGGRIPVEKMDLMNTINQLLLEMNKLKNEKMTLEEDNKMQRRCQMRDQVKRIVTARDVAMAANNKVADEELAGKLVMTRIDHLIQGRISNLVPTSDLALTTCNLNQGLTFKNLHNDYSTEEICIEAPPRIDLKKTNNVKNLEAGLERNNKNLDDLNGKYSNCIANNPNDTLLKTCW